MRWGHGASGLGAGIKPPSGPTGHHQERGADPRLGHRLPFLGVCQVMLGVEALKHGGWYPRLCLGSGVRELFQLRPSGLKG